MYRFLIPIATLSAVSGCGGTTTNPAPIDVSPAFAVLGDAGASATYAAGTDTYVVTRGTTILATTGLPDYDNGTFDAAKGTTDGEIAMFESRTDNSVVLLLRPNSSTMERPSVTVNRLTDTAIPRSGRAVIEGDYQAILNSGELTSILAFVDGRATINVEFGTQTVSGAITGRVARDPVDNTVTSLFTFEDLDFDVSAIESGGVFSGSTSGGEITLTDVPATSTTSGEYTGLLAGTAATEAVIGIKLLHDFGFGGAGELGAIAAGH